jgi:GntR family transcriptional regulator
MQAQYTPEVWTLYITIDETDRRPFYRQVVDEIKALIARGELSEGSSLPPVRQVASDLGVNLNTVAFAYRKLQQEGLIKIRHGAGAMVTSRVLGEKSNEHLRAQLRTALTHLVLAGLKRSEIKALVEGELNDLLKGSKL